MNRKVTLLAGTVAATAALTGVAVAASSPTVATRGHSAVRQTSVTVHGLLNPNGARTDFLFDYGLTNSYGLNSAPRSAGDGTRRLAVSARLTHLLPGTVYHYRLQAFNRSGSTLGRDRTFRTAGHPPAGAATGPANSVSQTGAVVTGEVTPHGQRTTWYFQYGLSTAYGVRTAGSSATGGGPVPVSEQLSGLSPGTIFHYRIVAVNRGIASFGADAAFMTQPIRPATPLVHARTKPRRDRHRPFVFTSSGTVIGPPSMPQAFTCFGEVAVHFLHGHRQVGLTVVQIQPNCTFSAQTVFRHKPVRHHRHRKLRLKVSINFRGNGYLAFARARLEHVTLG